MDLIAQETPYLTQVAIDAAQAIEIAHHMTPDLLVLNDRLPGKLNGIELYDYLHQIPGLAHIPAMIVSATLPEEDITARKIIGVHKPFELDDLLAQIDTLFASSNRERNEIEAS